MDILKEAAPGVVEQLVQIANDPEVAATTRLKAIEMLLERAYGKPKADAGDKPEGKFLFGFLGQAREYAE